jgi:DNA-binding NarL/FixJ family response regulator
VGSAWRRCPEHSVALGLSPNLHHLFEAYSATPPCEAYASRFGQVMGEISQGRANQEIAEQLGLTLKTVRNHVSNIFSKLQVADRAQAVIRAREAGLGYGKTEG